MVLYFKTLNTGSIANGSYAEEEWTPDRDIVIKKMMMNERTGTVGNNTQVYVAIADVPYTRDYVPAAVIGNTPEYCWKPELRVAKGAKIYLKVMNNEGDAKNWDIVLEYE
ncbi:MAG: hypothetical protein JRE40_16220 [Deltaproteobacteria bacterium]|nr:hypothetical protein [Deltaproteobacteria bacterium]